MNLFGLKVVTSSILTEQERIEHDQSRFIQYGPEDEWWRTKYGFVTYRTVPAKQAIIIGDTLYCHPEVLEKIREYLDRVEKENQKILGEQDEGPRMYLPGGFFYKGCF